MLLLHSLSHILSQSASSNTVRLAVLQDKHQFSNIAGSTTTVTSTITDKTGHKEPVIVITDDEGEDEEEGAVQSSKPLSGQGQEMDVGQTDSEIGSQVASLKMSDSAASMPSASAGSCSSSGPSAQFTLAMLSSALYNVNQSLGVPPGNDDSKQQEEKRMATAVTQSDTDTCSELPGEKRPRLDTHEVTTLQQSTLPQDIHDKLHSNIR